MQPEHECLDIFAAELQRRLAGDKFKDQINSISLQIVDLVQRELARLTIDAMLRVLYHDRGV